MFWVIGAWSIDWILMFMWIHGMCLLDYLDDCELVDKDWVLELLMGFYCV